MNRMERRQQLRGNEKEKKKKQLQDKGFHIIDGKYVRFIRTPNKE
jgi:hypothetical protein